MERPTAVPEEFEAHVKMVMDLQVLAYQTDMTRVITLMMAREGSNRPYRNINISRRPSQPDASPERCG